MIYNSHGYKHWKSPTIVTSNIAEETDLFTFEISFIGVAGDGFIEGFTEGWYEEFTLEWEKRMNHCLNMGEKIA